MIKLKRSIIKSEISSYLLEVKYQKLILDQFLINENKVEVDRL